MNFWTDSHAHIYLKEFDHDRESMLQRSEADGVEKIYMPNIDHTSIDAMLELEEGHPNQCIPMMGLHPCSVKKDVERELYLVESWLAKRQFAAIGEMGTDLYWDKTFWHHQQEAFLIQMRWAKRYELPLVIHCRESIDETIALIENNHDEKIRGVFHCFTGTKEQAERIIKLGFYLGLGGVTTFKNGGLNKVISELDAKYFLLETDSPYLSPVPHRGKRNEPSFVQLIGEKVASIKGMDVQEIQRITTLNAQNLFTRKPE